MNIPNRNLIHNYAAGDSVQTNSMTIAQAAIRNSIFKFCEDLVKRYWESKQQIYRSYFQFNDECPEASLVNDSIQYRMMVRSVAEYQATLALINPSDQQVILAIEHPDPNWIMIEVYAADPSIFRLRFGITETKIFPANYTL